MWVFRDRREAGRLLGERVATVVRGDMGDVLVLGLPRGGVAVALEIARRLAAPLDVFVVRKLDVESPSGGKVTVGVIAAGGVRVLDSAAIDEHHVPLGSVEDAARREAIELARLEHYYRGRRQSPRMMNREIVLVDDGLSPASSLRAAAEALAQYRPARVVVALPAASPELRAGLRRSFGTVIFGDSVTADGSTANLYEDASGISNREVRHLLAEAGGEHGEQLAG
jgi:putative phosphoribosyl transferase